MVCIGFIELGLDLVCSCMPFRCRLRSIPRGFGVALRVVSTPSALRISPLFAVVHAVPFYELRHLPSMRLQLEPHILRTSPAALFVLHALPCVRERQRRAVRRPWVLCTCPRHDPLGRMQYITWTRDTLPATRRGPPDCRIRIGEGAGGDADCHCKQQKIESIISSRTSVDGSVGSSCTCCLSRNRDSDERGCRDCKKR